MKNPFRRRDSKKFADLAAELGLQTSYVDARGETQEASLEDLEAVMRAMGMSIGSPSEVQDALRERRLSAWRKPLPDVSVAWQGEANTIDVRLPGGSEWKVTVLLESGETVPCGHLSSGRSRRVEGETFTLRRLGIGRRIPVGYQTLIAENGSSRHEGALFVAPQRCYSPEEARLWGGFAPAYALKSDRNWGAGDLTDLENFDRSIRAHGGDFVGTLPLLASFLDEPFELSPYRPVSRLFWNEFYLNVEALPEFGQSAEARAIAAAPEFQQTLGELRAGQLVDYRRVMEMKRRALEPMSRQFFGNAPDELRAQYGEFVAFSNDLPAYARFRAAKEGREGDLPTINYHLYAQWAMHQQLDRFAAQASRIGPGLYLDYPLGVHPDGFDVASTPQLFASGASAGAPPDVLFSKGQNWGLPPMRPDVLSEQRFDYWIRSIRHHLRYAGMLRIDHVMGLHRLFWVPSGGEPKNGVYVRYPEEEMFAVLCIESNRHRSVIVGEDLGTVPEEVRGLMEKRGVKRLFVLQYELSPSSPVPSEPATESMASINTHDMPTFAAFWGAADVGDRLALGLLDEDAAERERSDRAHLRERVLEVFGDRGLPGDPLDAALLFLAGSEAEMVLVNLEDIWREREPQNVPGTSAAELPNWRRKLRYDIRAAFELPEVRERLRLVNERRKGEVNAQEEERSGKAGKGAQ